MLIRQRGSATHPGKNVGKGSDDTLFALGQDLINMGVLKGVYTDVKFHPEETKNDTDGLILKYGPAEIIINSWSSIWIVRISASPDGVL